MATVTYTALDPPGSATHHGRVLCMLKELDA
jgi:hypothetical protein